MADATEQRETMVHVLREDPGSYTRALDDGTEVIYAIRASLASLSPGGNT